METEQDTSRSLDLARRITSKASEEEIISINSRPPVSSAKATSRSAIIRSAAAGAPVRPRRDDKSLSCATAFLDKDGSMARLAMSALKLAE